MLGKDYSMVSHLSEREGDFNMCSPRRTVVFIGMMFAFLSGCGRSQSESKSFTPEDFKKVAIGMTEDEVNSLLGKPMETIEALSVKRSFWKVGDNYYNISFVDGKVDDPIGPTTRDEQEMMRALMQMANKLPETKQTPPPAITYPPGATKEEKALAIVTQLKGVMTKDDTGNPNWVALEHKGINDALLAEIMELKSLVNLDVAGNPITDEGVKHIAAHKKLKELVLIGTPVTDAGMKNLCELKTLEDLMISDTRVTDAGLKHLAAGMPNLKKVNVNGVAMVSDRGLKELSVCKNLESLGLEKTRITDAGLKHLAGCTKIKSLQLGKTKVTDAGLKELAGFPLTTLDVARCQGITDAGIPQLTSHQELKYLMIYGTRITPDGVKQLKKALPKCDISHD